MPAAPSPHSIIEEAWRLVKKHGSLSQASRGSNIPRTTLQFRYRKALEMGYEPVVSDPRALTSMYGAKPQDKIEGIIAPEIPSEDEDLDLVMDRLAEAKRRRKSADESREWMRFTIEGDGPFGLVFVGDPHGDDCDIDQLRQDVELIKATPRMWAVGLGDYINQWNKKLFHKYASQTINERDAFRIAQWLFQQQIWMLIILGNHDGQRWHGMARPCGLCSTRLPLIYRIGRPSLRYPAGLMRGVCGQRMTSPVIPSGMPCMALAAARSLLERWLIYSSAGTIMCLA